MYLFFVYLSIFVCLFIFVYKKLLLTMFIVIFWTFGAGTVPDGLGQPLLQLFNMSQPNYFLKYGWYLSLLIIRLEL